jgi:hypothetical protein
MVERPGALSEAPGERPNALPAIGCHDVMKMNPGESMGRVLRNIVVSLLVAVFGAVITSLLTTSDSAPLVVMGPVLVGTFALLELRDLADLIDVRG